MMINTLKIKLQARDFLAIHAHRLSMVVWNSPIVVYQMPKTGSASIAASLKAAGFKNVFHVHKLNPNDVYPFEYSKKLASLLSNKLRNAKTPIKFITCVRDPVARNVSDLFQILKMSQKFQAKGMDFPFTFVSANKFSNSGLDASEIRELFIKEYPYHNLPLLWLDEQIKENLGIDIYSHPFPKDKGFMTISQGNVELLVLKLECDDAMIEEKIAEFVGNKSFKLLRTNVTSQDEFSYGRLYKEFRKTLSIPEDYIERMYKSKLVKHFYTEEEIKKMRLKWI